MANERYPSIDKFYEIAKEEYNYQRNKFRHFESSTKFLITVLLSIFTFESSTASEVFDFSDGLNNILEIFDLISICTLLIAIIILFILYFLNIKNSSTVDVVKFYNEGLYALAPDDFVPFYTAKYLKCIIKNKKLLKRLYICTLQALFLAALSFVIFLEATYLF